jgi:Fe2+ transport system protein B
MANASEAKHSVVSTRKDKRRKFREIFVLPVVIGVLCVAGLVAALIADGIWDQVAMILIAGPLVVVSWFLLRMRTNSGP